MPNYVLSERDYLALKRDHYELRRMMTNLRTSVTRNRHGTRQPRSSGNKVAAVQVWSTAGPAVGDILQASNGVHPGRIRTLTDNTWSSGLTVWIGFMDWEADAGAVFAVHGRYFVGTLSGTYTSGGVTAPLYICQSGEQTFLAQSSSSVSKGASGTFKLYHASESDSGFTQSAKALGLAITANKWVSVTRTHVGNWYAGCYET